MQILCHKQTLLFSRTLAKKGDKQAPAQGGDSITVAPKPGLQEVPDWVRNTTTFKAAEKAALVMEVLPRVAAAKAAAVPAPAAVPEEEEEEVPVADGDASSAPRARVARSRRAS